MKSTLPFFLVLAWIATGAPALAEPSSESLAKEGVELRRAKRDAEALAVFERALALDGSPRTRAQVALAEEALGLWVDAERELAAALAAGDDGWFAQHKATLESALDSIRKRLATLDVSANVSGADLWLNGAPVAVLPATSPIRVVAGRVVIEVRAHGYETQSRIADVAPETVWHERFDLAAPAEPPQPASEMPDPIAPAPAPAISPTTPRETPQGESGVGLAVGAEGRGMRTGAWIALGGAGVLLAGAGAALLVRNAYASTYNDDALCYYGGPTRDQRCGSYRDAASTAQTLGIVGLGAAVAAAGASILLFELAPKGHRGQAGGVVCSIGMEAACVGAF